MDFCNCHLTLTLTLRLHCQRCARHVPCPCRSVDYVNQLVAQEVAAGIPHDRIVVGGFSQGGHIALKAALQMSSKLAGCVALSTWLEPSPMEVRVETFAFFLPS